MLFASLLGSSQLDTHEVTKSLPCRDALHSTKESVSPCHATASRLCGWAWVPGARLLGSREGQSRPPPHISLGNTAKVQNPGAQGLGREERPSGFGVLFQAAGRSLRAAGPSSYRLEHRCHQASRAPTAARRRPPAPAPTALRGLTCSGPWKQILQRGVRMPLSTLLPSE